MSSPPPLGDWLDLAGPRVRKRIRLLMLLDSADYAVLSPIRTARLHAFAFLADVLSPIYGLSALSGAIVKRRTGPYFPELQGELDRLVGMGLVGVTELVPVVEATRAYVDASFTLRRDQAAPILDLIHRDEAFDKLRGFFRELAGALSAVPDNDLDAAAQADVTWDTGHSGTVIDYAGWRASNYSSLSADRMEEVARSSFGQVALSPGAKVNLYVRYLRRAANG